MHNSYIIVTPVYNEQEYIAKTIEGVLVQTVLPQRWIIVDDGSTDSTSLIIQQYAAVHPWIQYVYREKELGQTYYASNVYAIEKGLNECGCADYEYLAILDGDISLPVNYYEKIFEYFTNDEKLGIASGIYMDNVRGQLRTILNDRRSTPKALMVFRKQCYDQIGGFVPMKYGGEDTCICFFARNNRWKTWSFPDLVAIHNKPVGKGHAKNLLKIRFRQGVGEYFMATHPLFFLLKSLRRCIKEPPFLVGGLFRMAGFISAYFSNEERQISENLIQYIHKEQLERVFTRNKIPSEFQVKQSN